MIQFNLLPDVKKEYVKAKRARRLIVTGSLLASGAAVAVVLLLFSIVQVAQKKHINDLTTDIKAEEKKIQSIENIDTLLTVQNQLSLLPALHEKKPETSRIFDYIKFVSPENLSVAGINFAMQENTMVLEGSADAIATVNRFVDNIKAVKYFVKGTEESSAIAPYSKIATQLSGDNEGASFEIEMVFDPVIFDNTKEIQMNIGTQLFSTDGGGQ